MSQKLVSIIIPTYNRADMISDAVRSAVSQSYASTQIIVIDDGSDDDTAEKVAAFENVEYYYQENKGQGAARNLGLRHARGEYIASLDSDDVWDEGFLTAAVDAMERFETDFVFLNWREILEGEALPSAWETSKEAKAFGNKSKEEWTFLGPANVRSLFLQTCPAPTSALLLRRSSIASSWNERMKIADDWYLILEMALKCECRAAFTLFPYWTKHVHTSNIYHGRDEFEVVRDFGLHDDVAFSVDFHEHLTNAERALIAKRLSKHYFNFWRLNLRREGFHPGDLSYLAKSIAIAPVGSLLYFLQLSMNRLLNRSRLIRKMVRLEVEKLEKPEKV